MGRVENGRRGQARISRKSKAVRVDAQRQGGPKPDDERIVGVTGAGRIVLPRAGDPIERLAGVLRGVYSAGYLGRLRDGWR